MQRLLFGKLRQLQLQQPRAFCFGKQRVGIRQHTHKPQVGTATHSFELQLTSTQHGECFSSPVSTRQSLQFDNKRFIACRERCCTTVRGCRTTSSPTNTQQNTAHLQNKQLHQVLQKKVRPSATSAESLSCKELCMPIRYV